MRLSVCDLCGDQANSVEGLPCGRSEPESWDGPCPGTYQTPKPSAIIVDARRWRDNNGNTYHRATVKVEYPDGVSRMHHTDKTYGYGSAYQQTVLESLQVLGILPDSAEFLNRYCRDHDISLIDTVRRVRTEREL